MSEKAGAIEGRKGERREERGERRERGEMRADRKRMEQHAAAYVGGAEDVAEELALGAAVLVGT